MEPTPPTETLSPRDQRLHNLEQLRALGYPPFGARFERTDSLAALRAGYVEGRAVSAAGRLMTRRDMGKASFATIQDGSGRLQLYLKLDIIGEAAFQAARLLDLGDQIGVEGTLFTTRTGEISVQVTRWTLLSKSLLPLPDKWDGLQDVESRYRKRYLDLIATEEARVTFARRHAIVRSLRDYLHGRGFTEVETPMMQSMAGGASATPFETHYHALNSRMFFRIAPELFLKRLLVGGYDKIFELNRNFRNEGLSRYHNPEFTMLELYQAFGDMSTMKELVQGMICHLADTVIGSRKVGFKDSPVDLDQWTTVNYTDLITAKAGADFYSLDLPGKRERAISLGCVIPDQFDAIEIAQEIFEKLIEKTLLNPTFVVRLPAALVPLAKPCADDPSYVDVYELIIGGREISPGYSELNDPLIQRERFLAQAGGDESKIDQDFIEALEHGMPPAGGMGVGIDRLVMLLTGAEAIRDVILFPQLKAKG